jgi:hypothetical protein
MNFDVTDRKLIRYSAFIEYFRKIGFRDESMSATFTLQESV